MNYYEILKVSQLASTFEIRQSYKSLALFYHPDKSTGSIEKFQQILSAYEILSIDKKRKIYDIGLKYIDDNKFNYDNINFWLLPKIFIDYLLNNNFNISDFISHLYLKYNMKSEIILIKQILYNYKLKNIEPPHHISHIDISLSDYVNNVKQTVKIREYNICKTCLGRNILYICLECQNKDLTGIICNKFCKINFIKMDCDACNNLNYTTTYLDITPQSKYDNVVIHILQNDKYEIKDDGDLYTDIKVSLYDWLFGSNITYTHLDNKVYIIHLDGYINNPDLQYKLNDCGIHGGDLFINFYVEFTEEDQHKIKSL